MNHKLEIVYKYSVLIYNLKLSHRWTELNLISTSSRINIITNIIVTIILTKAKFLIYWY